MKTEIGNSIQKAIDYLNENHVIAIPTETVYGLAANAFHKDAVIKIFQIKNRPTFNPLIVHTNSIQKSFNFVENWNEKLLKLAEIFSPELIIF